jgi:hypothetical protein
VLSTWSLLLSVRSVLPCLSPDRGIHVPSADSFWTFIFRDILVGLYSVDPSFSNTPFWCVSLHCIKPSGSYTAGLRSSNSRVKYHLS